MTTTIRNTETETPTRAMRRLARTLLLAAGLALATTSASAADAPVFGPPSQEEVAVLRALLGVAPQPVPAPAAIEDTTVLAPQAATAHAPQVTAPAQTQANAASATSVTASTNHHAAATSTNVTTAGSPKDTLGAVILEANASSGHLQLASR